MESGWTSRREQIGTMAAPFTIQNEAALRAQGPGGGEFRPDGEE